MESPNLIELEENKKRISAEYRKRDSLIKELYKERIGKAYHPPGINTFILVLDIKNGMMKTLEIENDSVYYAQREHDHILFQYECTTKQFKTRLEEIYTSWQNLIH